MTKVRVSPHGGYLNEGAISSGTLRTQDLLRAFASEYERLLPFNGANLANRARVEADNIDFAEGAADETSQEILNDLTEALNELSSPHGLYFGTTEGDGACFGFWKLENDDA